MNEDLICEAELLGINTSMYFLLPASRRERALRVDIEKRRKEVKNGSFESSEEQPD